jgi:FMN phosphatase YigB (HAD superfamily)
MKKNLNPNSLLLPLKKNVVFVDWFGVLSKKQFLTTYVTSPNHPMRESVLNFRGSIFSNQEILDNWMKGHLTYKKLIDDFLDFSDSDKIKIEKSLLNYCENLTLEENLVKLLLKMSDKAFIVLATDNMDCFYESLKKLPQLDLFDFILSSNNVGALKKESALDFFGSWLESHEILIQNCLLIDDFEINCQKFEESGGFSVHYSTFLWESIKIQILNWYESIEY